MEDQIEHEAKRHEKLTQIIVQDWSQGENTFNPKISETSRKIL